MNLKVPIERRQYISLPPEGMMGKIVEDYGDCVKVEWRHQKDVLILNPRRDDFYGLQTVPKSMLPYLSHAGDIKMNEMKIVHLEDGGAYQVRVDDGCLVVSSGTYADAPKVWLSAQMIKWISENGIDALWRARAEAGRK